jgi:next-to-BRCA1 protein 1
VNPFLQAGSLIESPLTGEALLKRPEVPSVQPEMLQYNLAAPFFNRSLAALLNASSPSDPPPSLAAVVNEEQLPVPEVTAQAPQQEPEAPLSAIFVGDNNVSDSQVFPPGAEFVKSWRMLNDGPKAWPETTVLELVVGESFARDGQAVKVGSVAPGAVIDLWTGELKAPESSGKYVSYWRLHDGRGNMFGHSVWIDITVAEQSSSERSTDSSLASSSIIMPQSAPAKSTASSDIVIEGTVAMSTPVITSSIRADDTASDNGSDGSSVSLISIPSSDSEDDDPTIWEDSRTHAVLLPSARARAGMEYVVLYDDSSSDEA